MSRSLIRVLGPLVILIALLAIALPLVVRGAPGDLTQRSIVAQPAATQYNPQAAVTYALTYGGPRALPTNSDDCYIYTDSNNERPRCQRDAISNEARDGAHFIDCALRAGQLPGSRCTRLNSLVRMPEIIALIRPLSLPPFSNSQDARTGDILIAYKNNNPRACFGGIVVADRVTNNSTILIAAHSDDGLRFEPEDFCSGPDRIEFYRIITETDPPSVTPPELPSRVAYGTTIHLAWSGNDGPDGTGITGYTLRQSVGGQPFADLLVNSLETSWTTTLSTPCRAVTFQITATDNAGNVSPPVTRTVMVGLQGDFDQNNLLDDLDLARIDQALGLAAGQADYNAAMDINAGGRIDLADALWLRRHVGDHCP